jgi:hypothetical protein
MIQWHAVYPAMKLPSFVDDALIGRMEGSSSLGRQHAWRERPLATYDQGR